jgi:protein phosphatase
MTAPETDPLEDTGEFSPRDVFERGLPESACPATTLDVGARSEIGLRRPNNEDHYAVVKRSRAREILLTNVDAAGLTFPPDEAHAVIVADGMGGEGFGELASELVLRIGWELACSAPYWVMKFKPGLMEKIRERVAFYGRRIQEELREYADADPSLAGMGTTWTCAYVMASDVIIAHVGDSRAYLFHSGSLRQLTRDHTIAQTLQEAGVPPEETTAYKHLLVNSFGAHPEEVAIDVDHTSLEGGDRLLVCSDGLTDMVADDEIASILATVAGAQPACDVLVDRALRHGGRDNVTVVVADLHATHAD